LPNLQDLGKLLIGEDIEEILKSDLQLATDVRGRLQEAVAFCESAQDYVSRDLLESILEEEEEHIDWLESQVWLIENSGLKNYTQSMV
jgi:bacterioferritin